MKLIFTAKSTAKQFCFSKIVFLFSFAILLISNLDSYSQADAVPTDPEIIGAGEQLYSQNCKACHRIDQRLIGPALQNVYDRRDMEWIFAFVKNSQKVIEGGDNYAIALFDEYNKIAMTSFDFTDEEILSIIAYVKDQTDNPPVTEVVATGGGEAGSAEDPGIASKYLNIILIGLVITLVLLFVVLVKVSSVMKKYLQQKSDLSEADKELIDQQFDVFSIVKHKAFIGLVAFIVTALLFKGIIDQLYNIGVQQGYSPKQPIAYSHKVHAGDFEIDCNYCHTGVTKSKYANIPSANICMNCHSAITKGTQTDAGTSEIEKIYAAIENNQPIEWVRIHNLPDLAYFNHSQHVQVAGLACQTCHGEIQEMEVVEQFSNLTMGWCIDCHRTSDVKTKGNAYYDNLVQLHNNTGSMKVEDIGGLECAKCHY